MVYSNIVLIRGVCLNKKQMVKFVNQIYKYLNKDIVVKNNDDVFDYLHKVNSLIARFYGLKIYQPVCCSTNKKYIIGMSMKKIERIYVRCDANCDKYTLCDRCVGETSIGWFDVVRIHNSIVEVSDDNMCMWCKNITDEEICDASHSCECSDKFTDTHSLIMKKSFDKRIKTYLEEYEMKNYLWIDDCLSCT